MKSIFVAVFLGVMGLSSSAQFAATMEITEPIDGICNQNEVYVLFGMLDGQVEAECPLSEEELIDKLESVQYLQDNPKHRDKGMIGVTLNCKGEIVKVEMDTNTKSEELDAQFEEVFRNLDDYTPGKFGEKDVDSHQLISFKIKKGKVSLE